MINIREVAKIAGVSPPTVSRIINGTARVSSEKTAKVLQAISSTDYVPNEVARSLYRKSAKLIGLIIPSIKNPYFIHNRKVARKNNKTAVPAAVLLLRREGSIEESSCQIGNDIMRPVLRGKSCLPQKWSH